MQAKINEQGIKPIQPQLDAIAALDSQEKIAEYLRTSAAKGENVLFGFGPEADFKDSKNNIGYASQGGLGLPDKPYYFDADKKDKLAAYEQHVAKVLELSGVPAADAAKQAKDVIAFETRLAKASVDKKTLQRDVSLYYNPITPAEADKLAPNFRGRSSSSRRALRCRRCSRWRCRPSTPKSARCWPTCPPRSGRATCASTPSTRPRRTCRMPSSKRTSTSTTRPCAVRRS
jgi:predicted metalloendopeptidase